MWRFFFFYIFASFVHGGFCTFQAESCPPKVDIEPCTCSSYRFTQLNCHNFTNIDDLRRVFVTSKGYKYMQVHIEDSILPYLPHELFENVNVRDLVLSNLTIERIFDEPPTSLDELEGLDILNCRVRRGLLWELLKPMINLKSFHLADNFKNVRKLGEKFREYASKDLEIISFSQTKFRKLEEGEFAQFRNLKELTVKESKLSELSRSPFPMPFVGTYLNFDNNKISVIKNGTFTSMPKLRFLSLKGNLIASLPKGVFGGIITELKFLFLEDNPLKCDCDVKWLLGHDYEELTGTCESPKSLQGKDIKEIDRRC